MGKYRKKPVVVEAYRWTGGADQIDIPEWLANAIKRGDAILGRGGMSVKTLEGTMIVRFGDYVIRGVKGEIYPCKPDIFEATYEIVEEDSE